jgi:dGTPase
LLGHFKREDIEAREDAQFAPYAARSSQTRGRAHKEPEDPYRTCYQRDRDRIIHSTAFRRLEYKTQVFVNHEGDYYRTRLTHTIEVLQIARSVARCLRLNEDLVETVALAHDIGHTPFGHSGEEALHELMKDHGGFEHNRQGLRVVDLLENRYPRFRGLNLTYEVRESVLKHTTQYDSPDPEGFDPDAKPLLEAQVVDAADSIAYDNHDLDDALKAGLIALDDLAQVGLWQDVRREVEKRFGALEPDHVRTQAIRFLINREVVDLIETSSGVLKETGVEDVEAVRCAGRTLIHFSPALAKKKQELQEFLMERVYKHFRVVRMTAKAKRFVEDLFNAYISNPDQLPPEHKEWVAQAGLHRGVCDYIAGMTDRYAQQEHMKLFDPFERV